MLRSPHRNPSTWLRELVGNGVDLLFLCSKEDSQTLLVGTSKRFLRRLGRTGRLNCYLIADLEHAAFESSRRALLCDIAADYVYSRFSPSADDAVTDMAPSGDPVAFSSLVSTTSQSARD
jgi:hypothetical protein